MSRASTLILLGALTILAPFSGLPITVRNLLAVIFGASVLGIGFALRSREVRMKKSPAVETPSVPAPSAESSPEIQNQGPQGVSPI